MANIKIPVTILLIGLIAIAIILFFVELPEIVLPAIEFPQINFRDPFLLFGLMFIIFVIGGALYDRVSKQ